ncbi:MAG: prepilin-type N-terminal cleavage/methylation domain-containing protein [Candidatus Absconditabacterales bacterium]|nr:prepilin-type N-terminal cleavage/methylation domain-containing protein [Candidatus Absconditabacterales bacterium]
MDMRVSASTKKLGLTMIEVLISIVVFAIGVLGVMNALTWSIGMTAKVQSQLFGQFLAQEGIELAFAMRNANRVGFREWDCLDRVLGLDKGDLCQMTFASLSGYGLGLAFDPARGLAGIRMPYRHELVSDWEVFRLFWRDHPQGSGRSLGHTITLQPSSFARVLLFRALTGSTQQTALYHVQSIVLINDAVMRDTRRLDSMIGPGDF